MVTSGNSSRKTFVLDASAPLDDTRSFTRFGDNDVVLPAVVIEDLSAKLADLDLRHFAQAALWFLDELRAKHGNLANPVPIGSDGGTLRIESDNTDQSVLPSGMRQKTNFATVLAVARHLQKSGLNVTFVSKDPTMRLRASIIGLDVQEYQADQASQAGWPGFIEAVVAPEVMAAVQEGRCNLKDLGSLPANTSLLLKLATGQEVLTRLHSGGRLHVVQMRRVSGVSGRSPEQWAAIDMLLDPNLGAVSLGGPAGTGKSALALCAGLQLVKQGLFENIVVFRPVDPLGGQDIGFLPGTMKEKMAQWAMPVLKTLESTLKDKAAAQRAFANIEFLPLTYIRGTTLTDSWVILDEVQNLESGTLLQFLTRHGEDSKVVLCGDVAQRDNLRVGRFGGIARVIEAYTGEEYFGHVTMTRSERSKMARMAIRLLSEGGERSRRSATSSYTDIPGGVASLFKF